MPRFVGVDPGKTTGVCSFSIEKGEDYPSCLESYELTFLGAGQYLENHMGSYETIIACEAFLITSQTAKNSQAPWSLEVIGLVHYFSEKNHVPVVMQPPSFAKRLVSNDVLRRAKLYVAGEHARDAARHAAYLAMNQYKLLQHALEEA